MMTYDRARELYNSARNKAKGKPIGNNLRLVKVCMVDKYYEQEDVVITLPVYGIVYHDTVIVKIYPCDAPFNEYRIYNGGWFSITTKKNINKFIPYTVVQRKGEWFVQVEGNLKPFVEGLKLGIKLNVFLAPIV